MTILAGLVMLGVLVVVHEFGHFIVAKLFRIGVPVFSVGMGPRLFGIRWRGTDYRVSALPVGGYVRLAGADPFGEEDPDSAVAPELDFMKKPIWQRFLVMLAGPAFNLVLPFVLFTAVLMLGEPQPDTSVGSVLPGSLAEQAGVQPGDTIQEVDGQPVEVWLEVVDRIAEHHADAPVVLGVLRKGQSTHISVPVGQVPLDDGGEADLDAVGLRSYRMSTRIGVDDPASPAALAGLVTGDAILEVDGREVGTWYELAEALAVGESHALRYRRAVEEVVSEGEVTVTTSAWAPVADESYPDRFGVLPAVLFVGDVADGEPAEAAGVRANDRIVAVDGQGVRSWVDLIDLVADTTKGADADTTPRPLTLGIRRDGALVELTFAPHMKREIVGGDVRYRPVMGIQQYPEAYIPGPQVNKYYSLFDAVPRAGTETLGLFTATLGVLGSLFTGEIKPQESIGGPIEIFRMAGEGAERGIFSFVRLIGTISISLGIINLLPVPVLDGGQILFYAVEGIRGRPLSVAFREKVQMVGVLALVALMLVVAVFDVNRWWSGG
jgi:regulator of sigma E protease